MRHSRFLAGVLLLLFCLAGAPALAGGDLPVPSTVLSGSLRQHGEQLVWTARLDGPFSARGLAQARRTLCLLLERARTGSVSGVLCVARGRTASSVMRLAYMPVTARGRGPAHFIAATISRPSTSSLSVRFLPSEVRISYRDIRWQVLTTLASPPCTPATPNPLGCTSLFPAKPTLARLHTPRLLRCVPSGPSYVTNGSRVRHVIALTFDDGPWPDTPQFLDVLEREHVHATFFQIGEQVGTYGKAVDRRMLADGDIIGDHTWNHADVAGAGTFAAGEIAAARSAIARLTGFRTCLFRAPYGAVSSALIAEAHAMGFITIQWDVDPRDWARPGTGAIYSNVVNTAHNGSIVLQHDGGGNRSETLAALSAEIHAFKARGYQFVTIPQLLGLRLIYK